MWQEKAIDVEANARHCAKTCFFHLRRIRQLRRYVDHDILYKLICALILSRLDYCNSFLFACNCLHSTVFCKTLLLLGLCYLLRYKGSAGEHKHTKHVKSYLIKLKATGYRLLCGASARTHAPPLLMQLTDCQCRGEFSSNCVL